MRCGQKENCSIALCKEALNRNERLLSESLDIKLRKKKVKGVVFLSGSYIRGRNLNIEQRGLNYRLLRRGRREEWKDFLEL